MRLGEHLNSAHITTGLQGTTKFQIIEELVQLLDAQHTLTDAELALQDVLDREGYLSTGLEGGLAIPHAKSDGVDKLQIALGIKRDGVDFESLDGRPAQIIFLVLSPRNTSGPHIQSLAVITRNLKDAQTRNALLEADSAETIHKLIQSKFNM